MPDIYWAQFTLYVDIFFTIPNKLLLRRERCRCRKNANRFQQGPNRSAVDGEQCARSSRTIKALVAVLTFFLNDETSTPASAATASKRLRLVSNTLRLRSRSRVRWHTSWCLGSRSAAKSREHSGQRAMPGAGGPRSADSCDLTGCSGRTAACLATGCLGAAAGLEGGVVSRRGAVGFCCCWPGVPGGSLAARTHGFWTPAAVAALTLATASAAPAPAARALITVGCTTGGSSSLLVGVFPPPPAGLPKLPAALPPYPPPLDATTGFFAPRPNPLGLVPLPLTVANGFFASVAVLLFTRPAGRCAASCGQTKLN